MTATEFYDATPRELWNRLHGWQEMQLKQHRERWEQARFCAYWSLVPHVDSRKRELKITDIAKFPWEKEKPKLSRKEVLKKIDLSKLNLKLSDNLKKEVDANS